MRTAALAVVLLLLPVDALAQKEPTTTPPRPREPVEEVPLPRKSPQVLGHIAIGDGAPDFVLESASRGTVRLSKLRGDWLLLVFEDRSRQLVELRRYEAELHSIGARIVGVCHEKTSRLKSTATRDSVGFLLLSDVTGQVSAMYGLYDYDRSQVQPGFLVIDRKGIVRTALLGQRLPAEQVAQITRAKITGLW